MLVDGIGLRFTRVSTELNALAQYNPDWWAIGKLYAYRMQTEPFVHIDSDVFLWKRLPERLGRADVFAQNPEPISASTHYRPERLDQALGHTPGSWLPDEWRWYRRVSNNRGENCGIFGGNRLDFINRYASATLRLVDSPINHRQLELLDDKRILMFVIEQYLLSAFVDYHAAFALLPSGRVRIEYMFNSMAEQWKPNRAAESGYTHLLGGSKKTPLFAERLENRVRRDYPEYYQRCLKWSSPASVDS
jgi:hypothetical protein